MKELTHYKMVNLRSKLWSNDISFWEKNDILGLAVIRDVYADIFRHPEMRVSIGCFPEGNEQREGQIHIENGMVSVSFRESFDEPFPHFKGTKHYAPYISSYAKFKIPTPFQEFLNKIAEVEAALDREYDRLEGSSAYE